MKRHKRKIILFSISLFILAGTLFLNRTVKTNSTYVQGFIPIKDDALALRYTPKIISQDKYGHPYKLLYRAAKDKEGNKYIAYHYVWKREINNSKGVMPMLSRNIYTGGIGLQKKIFGKEDIEAVMLKLDKNDTITEVNYETAKDYNPKDFSVKHENIKINKNIKSPLYFKVMSWNHLFDHVENFTEDNEETSKLVELKPKYFSNSLWEDYKMFKEKETMLSKSRAHYEFERMGME